MSPQPTAGAAAGIADADAAVDRAPLVSVRDATVVRGGRTIWAHVNADVAAGEFVAILGPNGVGKSTLLKAILGMTPLAAGSVRLLGRPPAPRRREG